MKHRLFANSAAVAALGLALLAGCSGHGSGTPVLPGVDMSQIKPVSVSPASIKVAPMTTASGGPMASVKPDLALNALGYTQIPGAATQAVASPDGTLWVLSTQPAGPDKYIYHYVKGVWTNVPGQATQMAAAPDGSLYVINSAGGTYHYTYGHASPGWTALGGGAQAIAVGYTGGNTAANPTSIETYVISNAGAGADRGIWQNKAGVWTQLSGQGSSLASSSDFGSYLTPNGTVSPGGIYVLNAAGGIYYANITGSTASYVNIPGAASALAPTTGGGLFALSAPASPSGTALYYYNYATNTWIAPGGTGVSVSSDGARLYVVNSAGAIYTAPVTPVAQSTPNAILPNKDFISTNTGNPHYWGASAPANAFGFPVQSGYSGDGRTVAIIIDAVPNQSDMTQYLNFFQINRTGQISFRPVDGGGPIDDASGGEATLDAETIAGTAPGANVIVYDIPDLSNAHIVDAYNAVLSDGRAQILNLSFGGCEYTGSVTVEHPIFNSMNAAGIAVSVASGDTGNACYFNGTSFPYGAQSPASDPNVIAVGGTNTDSANATILTNAIWNDCATATQGQNCMSGGGVSTLFATPSYQTGLAGASQTGRNVPDIALPGNNAIVRLANAYYLIGGTSWSAPLNAGMLAGIYQYCNTLAIPNATKMYYNTFAASGYASFSDVTVGNDSYFLLAPSYSAAPGFDNVGGIGQPNGMAIATHICPGHVLSPLAGGARAAATVARMPAEARLYDNLHDLRNLPGLDDLGVRSPGAPTRVGILLRATPTLHADEATLVATLQAAGFTVVQRFPNAMLVDVEAPASTVARYFATSFHDYAQGRFGTRFANTTALTIPAAIAPYVQGIVSDSLVTASHGPLHLKPVF